MEIKHAVLHFSSYSKVTLLAVWIPKVWLLVVEVKRGVLSTRFRSSVAYGQHWVLVHGICFRSHGHPEVLMMFSLDV